MDLYSVPAGAVFYDDHAGVSDQSGCDGGSDSGRNTVCETVEAVCRTMIN